MNAGDIVAISIAITGTASHVSGSYGPPVTFTTLAPWVQSSYSSTCAASFTCVTTTEFAVAATTQTLTVTWSFAGSVEMGIGVVDIGGASSSVSYCTAYGAGTGTSTSTFNTCSFTSSYTLLIGAASTGNVITNAAQPTGFTKLYGSDGAKGVGGSYCFGSCSSAANPQSFIYGIGVSAGWVVSGLVMQLTTAGGTPSNTGPYIAGCTGGVGTDLSLNASSTYYYLIANNVPSAQIYNVTAYLSDASNELVNFAVYTTTSMAAVSATNPLTRIFSFNYTIPAGSTDKKVSFLTSVPIQTPSQFAIAISAPAGTTTAKIEKVTGCATTLYKVGSFRPVTITTNTLDNNNGLGGVLYVQVLFLAASTITSYSIITQSATSTTIITSTSQQVVLINQASVTSMNFWLMPLLFLMVPLGIVVMIMGATRNATGALTMMLIALFIGSLLGNLAGVMPYGVTLLLGVLSTVKIWRGGS
ncbi:MAG: hypothetical protein KGI71_04090 [Patescibacteria group bacterium]|nr:hypothetical protein [Patescibacteria group bacterium]